MGEITLHVAQIVNTDRCNTVYRRNMVCFRCTMVNTLNKGDTKDDDDDNNNNIACRVSGLMTCCGPINS